jgi:hypothetical protein
MQPQGWYRDPYGNDAERWFSDGKPTNLVRDYGTDSYDERPPSAAPARVNIARAAW